LLRKHRLCEWSAMYIGKVFYFASSGSSFGAGKVVVVCRHKECGQCGEIFNSLCWLRSSVQQIIILNSDFTEPVVSSSNDRTQENNPRDCILVGLSSSPRAARALLGDDDHHHSSRFFYPTGLKASLVGLISPSASRLVSVRTKESFNSTMEMHGQEANSLKIVDDISKVCLRCLINSSNDFFRD
jgi:hypothetical protein